MRISDWSSDVCSSDLLASAPDSGPSWRDIAAGQRVWVCPAGRCRHHHEQLGIPPPAADNESDRERHQQRAGGRRGDFLRHGDNKRLQRRLLRSEEHTYELQSLMRISYAVFCLKKKKIKHSK